MAASAYLGPSTQKKTNKLLLAEYGGQVLLQGKVHVKRQIICDTWPSMVTRSASKPSTRQQYMAEYGGQSEFQDRAGCKRTTIKLAEKGVALSSSQ